MRAARQRQKVQSRSERQGQAGDGRASKVIESSEELHIRAMVTAFVQGQTGARDIAMQDANLSRDATSHANHQRRES